MSAIKIALQQSQKSGKRKTCEEMSAEVSPDSKCPICLDTFNNISYLDLCLHKFCFRCIHEWSKNKAECPLCKQPFNSIYHSIKSEQDFKKYDLQPINNGSFGTFGGVRFRYRTTLTGVHRQMRGRTSPPPDNGVMFEASTNSQQQRQDRYIRRMMMRLAAKRRAASEGRAVNSVRELEMINFRRELYRQGVRVRTVRDGGRSRDTSAEFYRRNPACLHRLVPWLKRELLVLYGSHGSLVNIVQHIIMSRLTRYDMEDTSIQEELRPFIQGRTEHFLHEFLSFARSPFNMEAYDQHAVYDCPAPSSNEDSSSNSSVIAISEDEENSVEMDPPQDAMSSLSQSVWDDETPGPSYSTTAEQSRAEHLSVLDSDSDSSLEEETQEFGASPQQMSPHNQTNMTQGEVNNEEGLSSDSEDCVIVGFVKPTSERTPELVQLSSDSDESGSEDTKEVPLLPQHIRFCSLSPPASQSSDPSGAGRSENVETDQYYRLDSNERHSSSTTGRHKTSSKSDRKDTDRGFDGNERSRERHRSKDRDHRRRRRTRSRERRHSSRSPAISQSSVSTLSRERDYSNFSGRDLYSKYDSNYKRRDSYQSYQSYSHYSQERNDSGMHYTERRSYYYSSRKYSDRHSYSRSRSRSRDSRRRDKRYSRSLSSSCSPSAKRRSHDDKPGGKRKYKTRHLEEPPKNILSKSHEGDSSTLLTKHKKNSKEKHRKKSKERSRKSLSVELINEENSCERSKRHHKKKKKHKKKSKRHKSNERTEKRSATVITIDSDSDSFANDGVAQASSNNKDNPIDNTTDDLVDPATPPSLL
ncbi:topoisomerase I binding, arginine/serine-rich a [Seriola aureovittata]|uniref:topoisomerase I binding, arginine/serine-rich a n=1 Tax=Seriola aureovittata TaxID=2871759 RepID=UPI0024BF1032|nr:topoisomerase I binding, arginine/serine-rich a [Seriola aureovittata]